MSYFLQDELPAYDAALLIPKKTEPDQVKVALAGVREWLNEADLADLEATEVALRGQAEALGLKAGQLFMPIRVAVTGRNESPGLFETLRAIGKERVIKRVEVALASLD